MVYKNITGQWKEKPLDFEVDNGKKVISIKVEAETIPMAKSLKVYREN